MSRTASGVRRRRLLPRRRGSAVVEGGKGPRRKAVRPALDNVDDALDLARRELNYDLVNLPILRDEVKRRRDRFGQTLLGGPFGPSAIEGDSITIGGGALAGTQGCLGTKPCKSTWGHPALRAAGGLGLHSASLRVFEAGANTPTGLRRG
jgi:hypothetical protein